jgi:hypothetical protein
VDFKNSPQFGMDGLYGRGRDAQIDDTFTQVLYEDQTAEVFVAGYQETPLLSSPVQ